MNFNFRKKNQSSKADVFYGMKRHRKVEGALVRNSNDCILMHCVTGPICVCVSVYSWAVV